jgi:hypothetical protein
MQNTQQFWIISIKFIKIRKNKNQLKNTNRKYWIRNLQKYLKKSIISILMSFIQFFFFFFNNYLIKKINFYYF